MDSNALRELLEKLRSGEVEIDEVIRRLQRLPFEDLGFAKVDHHRTLRKGFPEVVFGLGKTPEQVERIVKALVEAGTADERQPTILVTKSNRETYEQLLAAGIGSKAEFHPSSGLIMVNPPVENRGDKDAGIVVVSAGTTDIPIAEEAALTAKALGCTVRTIYDAGVAGLHRLLNHAEELTRARVVIVVAGMEGALPSVVGGLVSAPVIAVPTSSGYGASFGGLSALLAMLNSCASGIVVVNIDNGFGAGFFAALVDKAARE
ncbi:MAG TPA: nickel pincer cofactor biosynthesis protein LarB [Acidobacteriota bacterium]|nr:nickel pincer cofactor biosynthesis protein LarB [Acidobacteriota bacterium]